MEGAELINALKLIAEAISGTFGPTCEVVIHDLQTREIVAIENGHVTGRSKGDKLSEKAYDYFVSPESQQRKMVGYPSRAANTGKLLKCSTIVIPDGNDKPIATFCINLDIDNLRSAREILDSMLSTLPLDAKNDESQREHVLDYVRRIISEIIQMGKPLSLSTKEGKLKVLKELDAQGVFLVRDVVPAVCEVLAISQATLYNYLRELRCEKQEPIIFEK